jgi:hypothetical protein
MSRVAVVASFLSLGVSGWAAWTVHEASRDAKPAPDGQAALEARVQDLEQAAKRAAAEAPAPLVAPAASLSGRGPVPGPAPGTATDPVEIEQRVARLEETAKQFKGLLEAADEAKAGGVAVAPGQVDLPNAPQLPLALAFASHWGSVADAAKALDLSPSQRADLERIAADAKREIGELHKLPDADGKTWDQLQKELWVPVEGEDNAFTMDMQKARAWREKTIPGRNESYGAAERRIVDDAKSKARRGLTPDQQAKWDKAHPEGVFGGEGFGAFAESMVIESFDGPPTPVPVPAPR